MHFEFCNQTIRIKFLLFNNNKVSDPISNKDFNNLWFLNWAVNFKIHHPLYSTTNSPKDSYRFCIHSESDSETVALADQSSFACTTHILANFSLPQFSFFYFCSIQDCICIFILNPTYTHLHKWKDKGWQSESHTLTVMPSYIESTDSTFWWWVCSRNFTYIMPTWGMKPNDLWNGRTNHQERWKSLIKNTKHSG